MAPQALPQPLPPHSLRCSQTNTTLTCVIPLSNAKPAKDKTVSEDGLEVGAMNTVFCFNTFGLRVVALTPDPPAPGLDAFFGAQR